MHVQKKIMKDKFCDLTTNLRIFFGQVTRNMTIFLWPNMVKIHSSMCLSNYKQLKKVKKSVIGVL